MLEKKYISKAESPRLFENYFLEASTRCHPAVPFIIFPPAVLFFLYRAVFIVEPSLITIAGLWLLAFIFWTSLEYFIHRYILHYQPTSELGRKIVYATHGVHHDFPNDKSRIVLPPAVTVPGAIGFYFIFKLLLGPELIDAYLGGLITSYLTYDLFHYGSHHSNWKNSVFRIMKKHHLKHHFKNSAKGYGFTTTLWDKMFKTDFGG